MTSEVSRQDIEWLLAEDRLECDCGRRRCSVMGAYGSGSGGYPALACAHCSLTMWRFQGHIAAWTDECWSTTAASMRFRAWFLVETAQERPDLALPDAEEGDRLSQAVRQTAPGQGQEELWAFAVYNPGLDLSHGLALLERAHGVRLWGMNRYRCPPAFTHDARELTTRLNRWDGLDAKGRPSRSRNK